MSFNQNLMKKFTRKIIIVLLFLTTPLFVHLASAQPPPPDAEPIPLDGGLSLLVAAGLAYGARKVYKAQKEEELQ